MNDTLMQFAVKLVENGHMPDAISRAGIRKLCRDRLASITAGGCEDVQMRLESFVEQMRQSEVALVPEKANEQHYELPPEFFDLVLGANRKYSSCYWPQGCRSLDDAENAALESTCLHAELQDGQDILELGCGWGSLTLWMAAHYPNSKITAVSNSAPQREHILGHAKKLGVDNINVITCDMNTFDIDGRFDRVVSVEMFEHMRNYEMLLQRIANWQKPQGKLFIHIFCHRNAVYPFTPQGPSDWMSEYFFTGGIMPSDHLLYRFNKDMTVKCHWRWNGAHYEKTANAWLANMDAKRAELTPILEQTYGKQNAELWRQRWRLFFMACAELFGFDGGNEWYVGHYLLEPIHSNVAGDVNSVGELQPVGVVSE